MNAAGRPPPPPPPHHSLNLNNSAHSADSIIMNRTEQWQITVQLRTQWEGIGSCENPTEPRRRKSSYGMHIYNYRNNNSLLLALLSHLIRSTVEYHLKHPHYATLMQENTWSLAFTWLCDWNEGLLRLGIITRLFRAGGTACHGCSQISGRLRFGTANHRLIKLVPSPVCNPRRQFHCFISDTKLFCWCSILRY